MGKKAKKAKLPRAYVRRARVKAKAYIKAVPPVRITKFVMGDANKFLRGKFNYAIDLVATQQGRLSDAALEASRMHIHRHLEEEIGTDYYFALSVYPHQVLRENKMLTGAGADRMQTGMKLSFGNPTGMVVQITPGKIIFTLAVPSRTATDTVRKILQKVKPKLGIKTIIQFRELKR